MKPIAIVTALALTATASASSFQFNFLPTSTAHQMLTVEYPLAGTFIGDYDATTNPTGTRTIPGLFGGSGNSAIPYTSTARMIDTIDSNPTGSFTLRINAEGVCEIIGFSTDLINETPGEVAAEMDISYSSFHTVAPNAVFPSVGQITIPFATGAVKVATATQSQPAVGALVATAPNTFTVSIPIPVTVVVSGSAGGQAFGGDPMPAVLAFSGTLVIDGATATFMATASSSEPIGPLEPPPPIVNQPFALPTVLPAGSTANLLISGTFSAGSGTSVFDISVAAAGALESVLGDTNGDGIVNGIDLTAVLSAWGSAEASCDFNGDGMVGGADLAALLSNWGN